VAYVDALGKVTAVNTGKCQITCSTLDGSVSTVCNITITNEDVAVSGIQFNPESLSLFQGQTKTLALTFTPANATNKLVKYSLDKTGIVSVDENSLLTALAKGVVTVTATSVSGGKTAVCTVTVKELTDYIIADFDAVIPVTSAPQPFVSQLYTPDGTNNIAFDNPMNGLSNSSAKVVKWGRPAGDWRLIGVMLPTKSNQDLSQFKQFQFKYFGKGIKDFYIQVKCKKSEFEINQNNVGEDCWKLFTANLLSADSLMQFNVFVNKTGSPEAINCYFDDFKLAGTSANWVSGTTLSVTSLKLKKGEIYKLTADAKGNPFSWVSANPLIAKVEQDGNITATGVGTTSIKAVPLYGDAVECIVNVEAVTSVPDLASNKNDIAFYPNPCSESLNLVVPGQKYQTAQVLNLSGQKIIEKTIGSEHCSIDTSFLKSGMYLLLVKGEEKTMTQKFIKN
jgi:uncharacterized protein YjdB